MARADALCTALHRVLRSAGFDLTDVADEQRAKAGRSLSPTFTLNPHPRPHPSPSPAPHPQPHRPTSRRPTLARCSQTPPLTAPTPTSPSH